MAKYTLTEDDLAQIKHHGMAESEAVHQLNAFEKGPSHLHLEAPCSLGKGIRQLKPEEIEAHSQVFYAAAKNGRVSKFLPASGAATRMFKELNKFKQDLIEGKESDYSNKEKFIDNILKFPFAEPLENSIKTGFTDLKTLLDEKKYTNILQALLSSDGLNYENAPKALLPFHRYEDEVHTALEEHFEECVDYVQDSQGTCRMHITISEDHKESVEALIEDIQRKFEKDNVRFKLGVSFQSSSTDTIAVDLDNIPARMGKNELLFRPGGHGALLNNLEKINGDIVFIKNIDNVIHRSRRDITYVYKKALGGLLVYVEEKIHGFLKKLSVLNSVQDLPSEEFLEEIREFCKKEMFLSFPDFGDKKQETKFLIETLNRPIRVCGMVKNEGEPGGGPFWVLDSRGKTAQIVESNQVNSTDSGQNEVFQKATHFNPVDLVCGLLDYRGVPFKLMEYRDSEAYILSEKSYKGQVVKAYEHPGLWNGSMAHWLTLFVEVPLETFTPVKEVFDLLKPEHKQI